MGAIANPVVPESSSLPHVPTVLPSAALALARMGETAKPAVPALIRAMQEADTPAAKVEATAALCAVGKGDTNALAALSVAEKGPPTPLRSCSALCTFNSSLASVHGRNRPARRCSGSRARH